ncbi:MULTISPECIES: threonine-phosphate decarboxylase CobD [unclassified Granulicatella]|uniref:threonine-phosphate decarboxylase CobD n=1 Tax=unclassified Granulicatella TaxID=2630493 RepID=UPI001073CA7D|nr:MULTISPECIES: threonine-phosphate decarboxylase CobD [unclassified Granulicatella]MBF0779545.1 threonine-phosphate decarboxylase [Granulicatella sp. 19428wC4_WM01]TFU96509.1 threonine-phosphate decarboxylase [Granulicatella sp. WM01]
MIEHGGNVDKIARQLGIDATQLVDFSANINPLGMPKSLKQKFGELLALTQHYPDIEYTVPREYIARYEQVSLEHVLLSNGAAQAFFEVAQALNPKRLLILAPTFSEYRQAFSQVGTEIIEYVLHADNEYMWTFEEICPSVDILEKDDVVLICNPNNPTGQLVDIIELEKLAQYASQKHFRLLIDEAFIDFVYPRQAHSFVGYLHKYPRVILFKSLTKFFAIPGLRLGYALSGDTHLLQTIMNTRVPWSVNGLASAAIPILLEDTHYHHQTHQWLAQEKEWLYEQLSQFKQCRVFYPRVNYIFFECAASLNLVQALLQKGILIRSCQNYTSLTAHHYRVAVKSREHNELLINALKSIFLGD